ncbi:hypothetical protein [Flavobacterium alkalisoli]|uniref:hypothetical protein n=1 Tax=Flavobacterium alkalisoli TaxID=2602769 RepID=UPI003A9416A5
MWLTLFGLLGVTTSRHKEFKELIEERIELLVMGRDFFTCNSIKFGIKSLGFSNMSGSLVSDWYWDNCFPDHVKDDDVIKIADKMHKIRVRTQALKKLQNHVGQLEWIIAIGYVKLFFRRLFK